MDAKISWREKLRRAVTYAFRAQRSQTERIVFDAVRKVGEFQKRNAWRNPEAINLVLKCNTATDLLGFDGKCYMFLLYILYPSASGQIEDVARLIAPELAAGGVFLRSRRRAEATFSLEADHVEELTTRFVDRSVLGALACAGIAWAQQGKYPIMEQVAKKDFTKAQHYIAQPRPVHTTLVGCKRSTPAQGSHGLGDGLVS